MKLRPYQEEAAAALLKETQPTICALPTGTGKTVVFSSLIRESYPSGSLVLVHRDELVRQAVEKISMVSGGKIEAGVVKAERREWDSGVVVASVQTVSRAKGLEELVQWQPKLVVVDEAHHSVAQSYQDVLSAAAGGGAEKLIGFTATPQREGLADIFKSIAYKKTIWEMVAAGYLCDIKAKQIELFGLDLDEVKKRGGDFIEARLGEALQKAGAAKQAAEAYVKFGQERKGLFFTSSVADAVELAYELQERGVAADYVSGDMALEQRRQNLRYFTSGKLKVLANCAVLTEGYDEPSIELVGVVRPTQSEILYMQMVGRGTRISPGKRDLLVLDFVAATTRHSLVNVASLLGKEEEAAEAGVLATLEGIGGLTEEGEIPDNASLVARAVDLVQKRVLNWLEDGFRFILSVGDGLIALQPRGLSWDVIFYEKKKKGPEILEHGLTLEYAQGVAEDFVRERGAMALANPQARWRRDQPTEKQIEILMKYGKYQEGMSKGQASDMLSLIFARKSR